MMYLWTGQTNLLKVIPKAGQEAKLTTDFCGQKRFQISIVMDVIIMILNKMNLKSTK